MPAPISDCLGFLYSVSDCVADPGGVAVLIVADETATTGAVVVVVAAVEHIGVLRREPGFGRPG